MASDCSTAPSDELRLPQSSNSHFQTAVIDVKRITPVPEGENFPVSGVGQPPGMILSDPLQILSRSVAW
ncbi:MAG: hypothetical protein B1H11_10425 [Desulfobacteraceae bacterium 4484_190.1]|nr:MAG: hypothetical protein B1H11_10425 [Desulfobacteraceae bacterium 4484_190.1]